MQKLMSAEAVAATIPDGATLTFPGNLSVMVADHLLAAIERPFLGESRPRDLTVFEPCNGFIGESPASSASRMPG
jgi:acyl CoA:acetate/3-ketoacid CoA transferase